MLLIRIIPVLFYDLLGCVSIADSSLEYLFCIQNLTPLNVNFAASYLMYCFRRSVASLINGYIMIQVYDIYIYIYIYIHR